jgi:hypothetical protein
MDSDELRRGLGAVTGIILLLVGIFVVVVNMTQRAAPWQEQRCVAWRDKPYQCDVQHCSYYDPQSFMCMSYFYTSETCHQSVCSATAPHECTGSPLWSHCRRLP